MKKFALLSLVTLSLAGTLYAGSGCCGSKKEKEAKTCSKDSKCTKTDGKCDKADGSCSKSADKK